MFFSLQKIEKSIEALTAFNPFFGITYLACKKNRLPVGQVTAFHMDSLTAEFMTSYFRVAPDSEFYFQPFKSNNSQKKWVKHNYPSTGLQSINTQTFRDALDRKSVV